MDSRRSFVLLGALFIAGCGGNADGPDAQFGDVDVALLNPLPEGRDLWAVAHVGGADYFAAGASGTVLQTDGSNWVEHHAGDGDLYAVWGSGSGDVHAGGAGGALYRFDGSTWGSEQSPTDRTIRDMHGTAPANVWAVGDRGAVLRFDGAAWRSVPFPTPEDLRGVWVAGPTDAYVCADSDVYRFNGTEWAPLGLATDSPISDVWGTGPRSVFAITADGVLFHFDGPAQSRIEVGGGEGSRLGGSGDQDIWITSPLAGVIHREGPNWVPQPIAGIRRIADIAVAGPSEAIAVGENGFVSRFDGRTWTAERAGISATLTTALTHEGAVLCFSDGFVQTRIEADILTLLPQPTPSGVRCGWAPDDAQYFVGTNSGTVYQKEGEFLTAYLLGDIPGFPHPTARINGIHGARGDDFWVVGANGTLIHWLDAERVVFDSGVESSILSVWAANESDVFAVTDEAEWLHFDGLAWSRQVEPLLAGMRAVWGRSADEIDFVGDGGRIVRYDRREFREVVSGTARDLLVIGGNAAGDLYAAGNGVILRNSDGAWTVVALPLPAQFLGVSVGEDGTAYVVGGGGAVLRITPGARAPAR